MGHDNRPSAHGRRQPRARPASVWTISRSAAASTCSIAVAMEAVTGRPLNGTMSCPVITTGAWGAPTDHAAHRAGQRRPLAEGRTSSGSRATSRASRRRPAKCYTPSARGHGMTSGIGAIGERIEDRMHGIDRPARSSRPARMPRVAQLGTRARRRDGREAAS